MNKPALYELMDKVDSKYTLIVVAAKRARQLIENNPEMFQGDSKNPVTAALQDIADGKVEWQRTTEPSK